MIFLQWLIMYLLNFEQGIMSEIEWKLYQDWFSWMIPKVNSEKHGENMTIYLQSNPETCYKRIKERARPEEKTRGKVRDIAIFANCSSTTRKLAIH